MRVTNGMISNNMMNSLYGNMNRLNTLFDQMSTLKKIQRPSDDPIIAGRSLKLRINVMESEQFNKNTKEATSWLEVTEAALSNVTGILKDIRTRLTQAANGTLTADDREKVVNDITQLYKQLQQEANVTYAGRYVFSGFKTNQPVYFAKDTPLESSSVLAKDMEVKANMKLDSAVEILKADGVTKETIAAGDPIPAGSTILAGNKLEGFVALEGDVTLGGEMTLPAGTIIQEDMVLSDGTVLLAADSPLATDVKVPGGTTLPKGTLIASTKDAPAVMPQGTINPAVLGKTDGQNIQYEIGVGNTVDINTLGIPELMKEVEGDIGRILLAMKGNPDANPPILPASDEELDKLFTTMLEDIDKRLSKVSEFTAEVGSKQNRLEYTSSRLVDDKTNFTQLLSETEDIDIEEVYVLFNQQYMVYQSALQATSKVIMNTLADFLR